MGREEELFARALAAVKVVRTDAGTVYRLATNRRFDDDTVKPEEAGGGVDRNAGEVQIAEHAISERFLEDLGAVPSIQEYLASIRMEEGERGITRLANRMAEIPDEKGHYIKPASARRARERGAPAKGGRERHANLSPRNRRRLLAVAEGERTAPYTEISAARRRQLRRARLALGVRGDWQFSEELEEFKLIRSGRESFPSLVHQVIERRGAGFVDHVEAHVSRFGQNLELLRVYALEIQRFR